MHHVTRRRILPFTLLGLLGLLGACASEGAVFTSIPASIIGAGGGAGGGLQGDPAPTELCTGAPPAGVWSRVVDVKTAFGTSVIDASGNLIFAGSFKGTVDFGGGPLSSNAAKGSVYVVKLDPAGTFLWAEKLGNDASAITAPGLGADSAGNIYLAGNFDGTLGIGSTTLTGAEDVFLAKLDPDGHPVWGKSFGDARHQDVAALSVTPSGRTTIVGCLTGSIDFGGALLTNLPANTTCATYLASFDDTGAPLFSKSLSASAPDAQQKAWRLTTSAAGTTILAVGAAGALDLGGGPLPTSTGWSTVLAAFDPTGLLLWSRMSPDLGDIFDLAVTTSGDVLVATGHIGGGWASGDLSVVRLDASSNVLSTSHWYQEPTEISHVRVVAVGNDAVLAGNFSTHLNLGCGQMEVVTDGPNAGAFGDIFVARIDPAGATHVSARFGGSSAHRLDGIAVDSAGDLAMTGVFAGVLDLGSGAITGSAGSNGGFLAKLHL